MVSFVCACVCVRALQPKPLIFPTQSLHVNHAEPDPGLYIYIFLPQTWLGSVRVHYSQTPTITPDNLVEVVCFGYIICRPVCNRFCHPVEPNPVSDCAAVFQPGVVALCKDDARTVYSVETSRANRAADLMCYCVHAFGGISNRINPPPPDRPTARPPDRPHPQWSDLI